MKKMFLPTRWSALEHNKHFAKDGIKITFEPTYIFELWVKETGQSAPAIFKFTKSKLVNIRHTLSSLLLCITFLQLLQWPFDDMACIVRNLFKQASFFQLVFSVLWFTLKHCWTQLKLIYRICLKYLNTNFCGYENSIDPYEIAGWYSLITVHQK